MQAEKAGDVFALWRPISFSEFVNYIVNNDSNNNSLNSHADPMWSPVTNVCEVCTVNYEYILKSKWEEKQYLSTVLKLDTFF